MAFHSRLSDARSRASSDADAPAAAVRTMTPPPSVGSRLQMSRRRWRSSSSRRLLMPMPSPNGTYTRKRPASESCMVSRAPLVPMGSLTACTITSSPFFRRSAMSLLRLGTPLATTSSTWRNPFLPMPTSMNEASIPASTDSTRPFQMWPTTELLPRLSICTSATRPSSTMATRVSARSTETRICLISSSPCAAVGRGRAATAARPADQRGGGPPPSDARCAGLPRRVPPWTPRRPRRAPSTGGRG